jgi:hypothetical protein
MDLQLKEDYPIGKTYIHENGAKCSQIDYILINTSFKNHISNIKIRNDSTNTSDYRTVTADIILEQRSYFVSKVVGMSRFSSMNSLYSSILTLSHFTFGTQRFSDDTVLDLPSADVFCSSIISAET